ncbi:PhoX family protein [Terricaulis sp.]|uniref:PhoX family protein n=1 Tax=Terricaulis sp. TaxID=2768686 RepID=UPI002AC40731|nr:alkaline phosphatase PhoX [Terricaulis sp.]MDZ4691306.1 DUF839 domain-containing protein [Terricaulis sp.]
MTIKPMRDLIASRRAVLGALAGAPLLSFAGCATGARSTAPTGGGFTSVPATNADTVTLPPGYRWRTLIGWGDALFDTVNPTFDPNALTRAEQEQRFGQNNDMLAWFAAEHAFPPPTSAQRMILCANNEYVSLELTYPSLRDPRTVTAAQIEALYAAIGVSIVDLEHGAEGWRVMRGASPGAGHNRRITPFTPVLFTGPAAQHPWIAAAAAITNGAEPDRGDSVAGAVRCGTTANCAGGQTPWGTYLTAEENFDEMFAGGENAPTMRAALQDDAYALDATSFGYVAGTMLPADKLPRQFRLSENPHGPALYGWVVEIDPYDPRSTPKKRTALGRKKNECAVTALTRDNRVAVYTGDDQRNEHVYKFISRGRFTPSDRRANMDLLDSGDLYAAQFNENGRGRWLHITVTSANAAAQAAESPIRFRDEGDLMMRMRDAARLLGATPMDRPEDIEALRDENWRGLGPVLIACTNNSERGFDRPGNPRRDSANQSAQANAAGHVLQLDEDGGDCGALTFRWDVFAMGGDPNATGLTVPTRDGATAHVSTKVRGAEINTGARFACPDNLMVDTAQRVWITTDGGDNVFADCNDSVMVTDTRTSAPRPVKRFLVGPLGAEICGPMMAPDERAFFCAIQHPGANNVAGVRYSQSRWSDGAPPPSHFPDGGESWPRSAVIVVTREDGGLIGD